MQIADALSRLATQDSDSPANTQIAFEDSIVQSIINDNLNILQTIKCFHPGAFAGQEQIMTGVVKRDGPPAVKPKVRKSTDEVTGMIADDNFFLLTARNILNLGEASPILSAVLLVAVAELDANFKQKKALCVVDAESKSELEQWQARIQQLFHLRRHSG
jgi:hypothetical protein